MMGTASHTSSVVKNHEWQYNPRVATENVERYQERASEQSRKYRHSCASFVADVPYGDSEDERLDIFSAGKNAPAHLFFHGGYWRGRDKSDYSFLADPLNANGITVLVANYSLCPKVTLGHIVNQTTRCLHALSELAERYVFDRNRITASGHSAGAHLLAAALFSTPRSQPAISQIKAITLISGIYDLEPVLDVSINDTLGLTPEDIGSLSPMRLRPRTDIALDIVVGGQESPGWIAQSALFAEKCQTAGAPTNFHIEPGENHYSIMEKYADPQQPLFRKLCQVATSC